MQKKLALISVSDKTHIPDFARCLVQLNFEILSTGGTVAALKEANVPVTPVADYTGFPEIMDGRVKTLHPRIHGGLLGLRGNALHKEQAAKNNIRWIDLVIVNLCPFEKTVSKKEVTLEEAVESIDIGGPTLVRSAAKNHAHVTVLVDPADYRRVLEELNIHGDTRLETRQVLAAKAFAHTAAYDAAIDNFLSKTLLKKRKLHLVYDNGTPLRHGENPHQQAVLYSLDAAEGTLGRAKKLHGREMSFNDLLDADAAISAVRELSGEKGAAVVRHTNPCGFATGETLSEAIEAAWSGDAAASSGSVVAVNDVVDMKSARKLGGRGIEILLAPDFHPDALEFLKNRSRETRILQLSSMVGRPIQGKFYRHVEGGMLEQDLDATLFSRMECVTKAPFPESKKSLAEFAYKAVKNIKSSAVVLAQEYRPGSFRLLGMGAGQPSRTDAIRKLCVTKADENIRLAYDHDKPSGTLEEFRGKIMGGCVLASDAFFHSEDNIIHAGRSGVRFIIEPGGSKADAEVIEACDRNGIAMIFTGTPHFKH